MWTLWENMMVVQRGYKRKDGPQQMSHHERYACDEKKDHSSDNLYVQDYTLEKHTQLIEQSIQCAHEGQAEHSRHIQKLEGGHSWEAYQRGLPQGTCQTIWMMVVY